MVKRYILDGVDCEACDLVEDAEGHVVEFEDYQVLLSEIEIIRSEFKETLACRHVRIDTLTSEVSRWRDAYNDLWHGKPVEVRMPDGALDEIVGHGGFHVEHLDKNLWFFDLGGCRFNVHGFDIRLQPIETDCWDNERERVLTRLQEQK